MLSKTIRNAAEYNEFDLETWAHEARKLEKDLRHAEYVADEYAKRAKEAVAVAAELREELKAITETDEWLEFMETNDR